MVTAGVYMIGRNAELFSHTPETLLVVAAIGAVTALMAGTIGLVQNDIKRVLAYSTVSQLGYMFLAMGMGAYAAGIFHLYTHAFFKALLFLGSGAVIHALAGEQDIRHMGGLKKGLPVTYWTFLIGAVAIAGVPPLAGFFSKDEILFRTFAAGHWIFWSIGIVTSLLTAAYMFRLVFLTFHGERRGPAGGRAHPVQEEPAAHGGHGAGPHMHLHDAPPAMAAVLVTLAVGSVLAGFVGVPAALGGSNRIEHFLAPSFSAHGAVDDHAAASADAARARGLGAEAGAIDAAEHGGADDHVALERTLMLVSTVIALLGIGLAYFFYMRRPQAAEAVAARAGPLHRVLLRKYYVDEAYDAAVVQPIRRLSERVLWRQVDAGLIDGAVNGTGDFVGAGSAVLRRLQTGSVRAYAASIFLGVVLIVGYYLWRIVQVAAQRGV
jgi:NADH-quinone oxidoreductase subunit L